MLLSMIRHDFNCVLILLAFTQDMTLTLRCVPNY